MNDLTTGSAGLSPCTPEERARVEAFTEELQKLPQIMLPIEHTLHAGVYARTTYVPAGVMGAGAELAVDTILICDGHARISSGSEVIEVKGHTVLTGLAGRKSICYTLSDCIFTTIMATTAKTVDEAEREYTREFEKLQTRSKNYVSLDFSVGNHCGLSDSGCVGVLGQ